MIDTVIINGAECEPYLTADHRLMLEKPEEIIFGLEVIMKVLGAGRGIVGIEDNKPDAIRVMKQVAEGKPGISIVPLKTKYPQGAEKMLIQVTTRRRVPSGGLPLDVGVVNHNTGTAVAIADAIQKGKPLIERVVTVTGEGVRRPANLLVRVGTLVNELLDFCGGLKEETRKLVIGGPMMGLAQPTTDLPVIKGTSGLVALTVEDVELSESGSCIRCARCVEACPINLVPTFIAQAAEHEYFSRAEKLHVTDCIECGCCAYVCPARIPLTQWIRIAKQKLTGQAQRLKQRLRNRSDSMNGKLVVSSSPHIRTIQSVPSVMLDVLIALGPVVAVAIFLFGYQALITMTVAVAAAMLTEALWLRRLYIFGDGSAAVTGLLLAMTLPPNVSWWIPQLICYRDYYRKQVYGGIGNNIFNPEALAGLPW